MKNHFRNLDNIRVLHLLLLILGLGLFLRLWGINFGLPYFNYPDEGRYTGLAINMLDDFDFNPHYFINPPLLTYILAGLNVLYFIIGKIFGLFSSPKHFADLLVAGTLPISPLLLSRIFIALLGTTTCFFLYKIGKKLFNKSVGVISCALLAFSLLHIKESHIAVNDVAATFFMIISFNCIVNVYTRGRLKDSILSGVFVGMSIAIKYNVGLIIIPLVVAHLLSSNIKDGRIKKLMYSLCICFTTFFLCCPWILLDYKHFFKDFLYQAKLGGVLWAGSSPESSYIKYLKTFFWGYGLIPFGFFIAGTIFLWKERTKFFILLSFPLVYYLFLGKLKLFFIRFAVPMIPFLCLISAYGIFRFSYSFTSAKRKLLAILTLLAICQGIFFSIKYDYLLTKGDTRIIARNWIIDNIPPHSKIFVEWYGPNLGKLNQEDQKVKNYELYTTMHAEESIDKYMTSNCDYYVANDNWRRLLITRPGGYSLYDNLEKLNKKIFSISPAKKNFSLKNTSGHTPFWDIFARDLTGPKIKIYQIQTTTRNRSQ